MARVLLPVADPHMTAWRRILSPVALAAPLALGCVAEQDRADCDDALKIICGCASRPCDRPEPPEIVVALRRCGESDVRPRDQQNNVHLCVQGLGKNFCGAIDALVAKDDSVCSVPCDLEHTCSASLERDCEHAQYETCDLAGSGAAMSR